ncbi:MAG: hypothetical protein WAQ27_00275 [Candidatus Microsaccharimonas sp.]
MSTLAQKLIAAREENAIRVARDEQKRKEYEERRAAEMRTSRMKLVDLIFDSMVDKIERGELKPRMKIGDYKKRKWITECLDSLTATGRPAPENFDIFNAMLNKLLAEDLMITVDHSWDGAGNDFILVGVEPIIKLK